MHKTRPILWYSLCAFAALLLLANIVLSSASQPSWMILLQTAPLLLLISLVLLLREDAARQKSERQVLVRISEDLAPTVETSDLFDYVVHAILGLIPRADKCIIHLLDDEGQRLFPHYSSEPNGAKIVGIPISNSSAGKALRTQQTLTVDDVWGAPEFLHLASSSDIRSMLVAPLQVRNKPLGTISVNSTAPRAFNERDELLIRALAAQLAAALYQSGLHSDAAQETRYVEAIVDQLTDGLIVLDRRHRIVRYNPAVAHLLGTNVAQIIGQRVSADSDVPGLQRLAEILAAAPEDSKIGAPYQVEIGEPVRAVLQVSTAPVATRTGNGALVIVIHDQTAQVDAVRLRTGLTAGLVKLMAQLAGQIRSSLPSLGTQIPEQEPETRFSTVRRLCDLLEHTSKSVQDSLPGAEPDMRQESVALEELLDKAVKLGRGLSNRWSETVTVECQPVPARIIADGDRTQRIVVGLLLHALTRLEPHGAVRIRAEVSHQELFCRVEHDGQPISESARRSLLGTDRWPSNGAPDGDMSLILARAMVKALDGHLWLESANPGTIRVAFAIPLP